MTPSSPNSGIPSPLSDDSSIQPHSPVSPSQQDINKSAGKRKPSRRASTAERRATHNAVERARRETLNGRFLVSILDVFICYREIESDAALS